MSGSNLRGFGSRGRGRSLIVAAVGIVALAITSTACGSSGSAGADQTGSSPSSNNAPTNSDTSNPPASGGDSTASASDSSAAAPTGDPIQLGLVYGLSGACASAGKANQQGGQLAVDQINAAGGVLGRPLSVVSRDTKCDANQSIQQVRSLSEDGVHLLFGIGVTSNALGLKAQLPRIKSMLVTTAASGTDILPEGTEANFLYRIGDNTELRNVAAAMVMHEQYPDVHKWANVSPDYDYGHQCWEYFQEAMKKLDPQFEAVESVFTPLSTTDYRPYAQKVMDAKPEGVFSSLYTSLAVTFYQQVQPLGFFDDIKSFLITSDELDVPRALGSQMGDEWAGAYYVHTGFDNPMNTTFLEGYKSAFNEEPNGYAANAYNAVYAYKAAIEKAGTDDATKVNEAMRGLTVDTVQGQATFAENGQAMGKVVYYHVLPQDEDPGWKIADVKLIPAEDALALLGDGK